MIKISTVIPVYNIEKYLNYCIDSVFNQTYKNVQIVLLDDGSNDSSPELCDRLAKQYSNIIVVHKHNKGASDTRNIGLKVAEGEYVHFVDSDDLVHNDLIYARLVNNELKCEPDIVFSRRIRYNENLSEEQDVQVEYNSSPVFHGNILLEVLRNKYVLTLTSPVNKIFKREFLINNDLFFTVGLDHEEDEWLPRVIANAKNACFCNDILYSVRYREAGTLSAIPDDRTRARKAKSKIRIAVSGMEYMLKRDLDKETLAYITEYYWGYMLDAVISANLLKDKALKKEVFCFLKQNKKFFKNKKYLVSKSWRLQGLLFQIIGVTFTAKLIERRYKS